MTYFKDILGQKQVKEHLQTAIKQKNISHAYLFAGEVGSGRRTMADAFARALLCESPTEDGDSCGRCKSCMQAGSKNHPDIHYLTHDKFNIRVDEIREQLNSDIQIKPYSSAYKVYIIPEAHRMNEQAQNALLKTLEEPPAYAVIILLCDNASSLLQTITSRCVTLQMKPVSKDEIAEYLMKKLQMEADRARLAAGFCQGNIGQAIRFASSEDFQQIRGQVLKLLKEIDDMPLPAITDEIRNFSKDRTNFYDYMDLMLLWYRDVLMYKATKDTNILLYHDEYSAIQKQASKRSYEDIEKIIQAFDKVKIRLDANVNFDLAIELLLLTIKDYNNR